MVKYLLVLIFCALLAGCGQKGDLYMPEKAKQHKQDEMNKKAGKKQ